MWNIHISKRMAEFNTKIPKILNPTTGCPGFELIKTANLHSTTFSQWVNSDDTLCGSRRLFLFTSVMRNETTFFQDFWNFWWFMFFIVRHFPVGFEIFSSPWGAIQFCNRQSLMKWLILKLLECRFLGVKSVTFQLELHWQICWFLGAV